MNSSEIARFYSEYYQCAGCRLHESRSHVVFGRGCIPAPILIIGEAPGAEEDRQGIPFVGRSGELLQEILDSVGLTNNDVYITNVCLCRPPNNRDPLPDEIAACNTRLHLQIGFIEPEVILALGRFAAQTISGNYDKITNLRNNTNLKYCGTPVVAEYHPSYSLRNGRKFDASIAEGVIKAALKSKTAANKIRSK